MTFSLPPTLSFGVVPSAATTPVLEGRLNLPDVQIQPVQVKTVDEVSRRMMAGHFDLAEMSLATYVAVSGPDSPFVGLPIFTGRRFIHGGVIRGVTREIQFPKLLLGRRVAVPQYWLTSSIWHRGLLLHRYGIHPEQIHWVTNTLERIDNPYPPGVDITYVPGVSIVDLLLQREVDAAMVPRRDHPLFEHPELCSMFSDVQAEEQQAYADDGIWPIMHLIVAKKEAIARYPELSSYLINAFNSWLCLASPSSPAPPAPQPSGSARRALSVFLGYCNEQGLLAQEVPIDDALMW